MKAHRKFSHFLPVPKCECKQKQTLGANFLALLLLRTLSSARNPSPVLMHYIAPQRPRNTKGSRTFNG